MSVTKLKTYCGKVLSKLGTSIPKEEVSDGKGGLDLQKFNNHLVVISMKKDMARKSVELLGKNVVCREWFREQGFLVAGMLFNDTNLSS